MKGARPNENPREQTGTKSNQGRRNESEPSLRVFSGALVASTPLGPVRYIDPLPGDGVSETSSNQHSKVIQYLLKLANRFDRA